MAVNACKNDRLPVPAGSADELLLLYLLEALGTFLPEMGLLRNCFSHFFY
jgi:hypothetical protein